MISNRIKKAIYLLEKEWKGLVGSSNYQNEEKLDREDALDLAIGALREKLGREQQPSGWIETEWETPGSIGERVLIYPIDESMEVAEYVGDSLYRLRKNDYTISSENFTHWHPLPEPPKEATP